MGKHLMSKFTRRTMIAGGLVGGAFAIGYAALPGKPAWNGPLKDGQFLINNWIKLNPDGSVTAYVGQAEMGQGIHSGFATVLAEEMGADWARIDVQPAPDHPSYSNILFVKFQLPFFDSLPAFIKPAGNWILNEAISRTGNIATGGSTSMRDKYERLREAGAFARMTLQQAAADMWDVAADECAVAKSAVTHTPSGKRLDFADLVQKASITKVTRDIELKPDNSFTYIGKEGRGRLDIPAKVQGKAIFGADVRPEGLVYAAVRNAGASLGTIASVDSADARAMSGVIDIVETPTWVAVVGKTQWHAQSAVDALDVRWDRGDGDQMINDWQEKRIAEASQDGTPTEPVIVDERAETLFADASDILTATYSVPYLAHACLETNNATARWDGDALEIWAPNQSPTILKMGVNAALGDAAASKVTVHTTLLGGGFGRKVEPDACVQAALIAQKIGRPIQVSWSRKEDLHADMFRPAAAATMVAAFDADRSVRAVRAHVSSQSVGTSFQSRWFGGDGAYAGGDASTVEGLEAPPYDYGAYELGYTDKPSPAQVGFWRSVGHSYTAYFAEAFVDEMAAKAGEDPLAFRMKRMTSARAKTVLQKAADMAQYERGAPSGRYQGVAFHDSFGSLVAMVVEIEPAAGDEVPKVTRVFAAIDCGKAIDPDTIRAQVEGSVAFGLTAALFGELKFENGVPNKDNFDSYRLLSLAEMPEVTVEVLESDAPIGGVGEPGVPPVAPALANAVFQWRGSPVRSLPLSDNMPADKNAATVASAAGF